MATANRRKMFILALGMCLLILFAILAALNAFNVGMPNPSSTQQFFVFTGLSILAFLLFVAVLLLLVRNVLKLYADQRSRVMGARLRTRMLWGAVLVSLIPIVFMFLFSYGLMNRAVDRWFSQPVTQMRDDSNHMALELAQYTTANARAEADSIASGLPPDLNRAVDRWFSQRVTQMREDSNHMALELAQYTTANARAEADSIASGLPPLPSAVPSGAAAASAGGASSSHKQTLRSPHRSTRNTEHATARSAAILVSHDNRDAISKVLRQHQITLQNGFAIVYR